MPRATIEEEEVENKYLVVGDSGTVLHNHTYKIVDSMPVSFSSANELAFTNGNKLFFYDFMSQNLKKMDDEITTHKDGAVVNEAEYPPDTSHEDISDLI